MHSPVLLCVDDRPQMLHVRKANLERLGYFVMTATSVQAAIAALQNTPVAAVLVEYKSEGMDAEALAYHLKQRFPHQPIVLLSAYSKTPERVLWLVDEFVMRSDPLDQIPEVIERVTHPVRKVAAHSAESLKRAIA